MSQAADSAGVPFAGRHFEPHPFAGDDGSRQPATESALAAWQADHSAEALSELVEALRTERILVPLIAEAGDVGQTDDGRVVEKTQELSVVTVEGPGGEPVGLVFSDVTSLQAWRSEARPQPAEATRAAAWALEEGFSRLVVNPGSPDECVLRRGVLVALVTEEPYRVPWGDDEVTEAIAGPVTEGVVRLCSGWELQGGSGPDLVVEVGLPAGLSAEELSQMQRTWAEAWGSSEAIARYVDGIHLSIVPA